MSVCVSKGNTKIGKVLNISLTPVASCPEGVPCAKKCYALKSYKQYKNVRDAWDGNLKTYKENPTLYFSTIREKLKRTKREFFRWHVAGDIQDQLYLNEMKKIATEYPHIKFKAATKMRNLDYSGLPKNLRIWFSNWPEYPLPDSIPEGVRQNWLSNDTRKPEKTFKCRDHCEQCGYCYDGHAKRDVEFELH